MRSSHVAPAPGAPASEYVVDLLSDPDRGGLLLGEAIPQLRSGEWQYVAHRIVAVRGQRLKPIVLCSLTYRNAASGASLKQVDVVAKVCGSDRGAAAHEALQQLWQAGFAPPARSCVARPFGYLPSIRTLFQGRASGLPWAEYLSRHDRALVGPSRRAAAWLVCLQRCSQAARAHPRQGDVADVERFGRELADTYPQYGVRLRALAAEVALQLDAPGQPVVPSHGDYHPRNVFLTAARATVIDFDTFALAEPAFDVGYALGQLLVTSYLKTGAFARGLLAGEPFWGAYGVQTGSAMQPPWARVAVQLARTLLQSLHFELCTLRNGRTDLVPVWLALIEMVLTSDRFEAFASRLQH